MSRLRNNNGLALLTALLFTLISLGIIMALLTIVIQGTRVSAANKTYKSSTEAGYGAVDLIAKDILPAIFKGTFDTGYKTGLANAIGMALPQETCFNWKLNHSTANWGDVSCNGVLTPTTTNPKQSPDMTFNLKATNDTTGYNVYTKISDTRCGGDTVAGQPCSNSDTSGIDYLDAGGGVTSSSGSVTPQHRPAYFRIEVQSERAVNPKEKSQLSVLYAY